MIAFNDPDHSRRSSWENRTPASKSLSPVGHCVNMISAPGGMVAQNFLPPDDREPCPESVAVTPLIPFAPVIAFNEAQHSKKPSEALPGDQTVIGKSGYDNSGATSTVSPHTCITNMTYDPGNPDHRDDSV